MPFRPMLASNEIPGPEDLRFPMLVSPKVDGIRCCIIDGVPLSRKLKPIENRHVTKLLTGLPPLDGELVVGSATSKNGFDASQSGIMSRDGEPDFTYLVFDIGAQPGDYPFVARLKQAHQHVRSLSLPFVRALEHFIAHDQTDLDMYEKNFLAVGYEGLMIRDPHGKYKHGRSTLKEGLLLKMVRKRRDEVILVGFSERMHNENEKVKDERGLSKRSTHKANKSGTDMLGKFHCIWADEARQAKVTGKELTFECGSGFDHEFAKHVWNNKHLFWNKVATIEYREETKDGKPRFPVWKGLRHADDMGSPA